MYSVTSSNFTREEAGNMAMTLKAARVNAGLTQAEAAEKLKIAISTLQAYEQAKSFPDVPMITKIEALYGIGYNDIDFLCEKITV